MNFCKDIVFPIITNIASPIILFLVASQIMKINRVSKFISKIYTSVKNGLELNTDDNVPESPKLNVKKLDLVNNIDDYKTVLRKISKDYGNDAKLGWKVRTFYTLFKEQLIGNEIVSFEIREHSNIIVNLKSKDLIKEFDLNNPEEDISDGSGKIRIYIFQDTAEKLYLVRFGKKNLSEPILLE